MHAVGLSDILGAAERIQQYVHRTPVMTCGTLDALTGRPLHMKCENLQRTGSFKLRGATNAVLSLPDDAAARGVVTHSSGNHGQALALAARLRGIPCTVVMPHDSARVKKDAVRGHGASIVECEPNAAARAAAADRVVQDTGATLIPPYDHPHIIAGQGTVGLELLAQEPGLGAVIVPIGGGGLISGVAIAMKALRPDLRVIAAEPLNAGDAAIAKRTGRIEPVPPTRTIADGLRTPLGTLTFPVVRDLVDEVITVTEDEIVAAMRLVWERMKLVIEPSSAVGVAVAVQEGFRARDPVPTGIVLCGGNVDLDALPWMRGA
jgi:threonine dehydratase/serine racemase